MKRYRVTLEARERNDLEKLVSRGKALARRLTHARILLLADESPGAPTGAGQKDEAIVKSLRVSLRTVERVRERFVERGLAEALDPLPSKRVYRRKLDGKGEAQLIALACSAAPEGRKHWTMRLLADAMVELEYVDSISHETVSQVLKKNEIKPWLKKMWCIPAEKDCEFVAAMEDVLEVYHRPYDEQCPQVNLDETNKQLIGEVRDPLPVVPGHVRKYDNEYVRNGTVNLFMAFEPLAGWREVTVSDGRKRTDWAGVVKALVDGRYKDAKKLVLVMDNLNTHSAASLYEAFAPAEARRIAEKLEIHYTPKHGSWLNMAEIELSVLTRQCLDRRMEDKQTLQREVAAWQAQRNAAGVKANWRFTTADARIKLRKLYPLVDG